MLRKVIPEGNQVPISVFQLFQYIKNRTPSFNIIKHSYCKICLSYNGIAFKINKCFSCNTEKSDISFFFEIDIYEQLKFLFENLNLAEKLKPSLLDCDKNNRD